jgi:hypothetical protein
MARQRVPSYHCLVSALRSEFGATNLLPILGILSCHGQADVSWIRLIFSFGGGQTDVVMEAMWRNGQVESWQAETEEYRVVA